EAVLKLAHDLVLVVAVGHVDEVDDDEAAEVAQAELAGDDLAGREVGMEDDLILVLAADVLAAVDVDGGEGLGFVDDEEAAVLEPDLAAEGLLELLLDLEDFEDVL